MAEHAGGHGGHGNAYPHSTHHASWWPLIVGVAVAILGLSLFWARQEDSEDAKIPVLAAAAAFVVVSAAGWAFEEGSLARRMRGERIAAHLFINADSVRLLH